MCEATVNYSDDILHPRKIVYDLFNGKDFIENAKSENIRNYDGTLSCVFIVKNGKIYTTNLGLITEGLTVGGFLFNAEALEQILEDTEIYFNWANK